MTRTALHRAVPAAALLASLGAAPAWAQQSEAMKIGIEQPSIDSLARHAFVPPGTQTSPPDRRLHGTVQAPRIKPGTDLDVRQSRLQCALPPGVSAAVWKCRPQQ